MWVGVKGAYQTPCVGGFVPTCTSPMVVVVGDSLLMSWGRGWICGDFIIRVSIWLGSISPYSFELGLGLLVVSWLWHHSRGRVGQHSVYSCCQVANERSLHLIWYDWSAVWKRAIVILAVVYEVLSKLLGLLCISSLWKAIMVVSDWAPLAHGSCNRIGVRLSLCFPRLLGYA